MFEKVVLADIVAIAKEAGDAVMKIYEKDFKVSYKDDKSPLTEADLLANKIISTRLNSLFPSIYIMSEETQAREYAIRKDYREYWCVDPIDGTKEFIKKNGEFTINIALIKDNKAVLGVVYAPALGDMYSAKLGEGSFKNTYKLPIYFNNEPNKKLVVVASKSHLSQETKDYIKELDTEEVIQISVGSSLKLCLVAEGKADVYPRLSPTMEWDIAAANVIVSEAGKNVFSYKTNKELKYNKIDLLNEWFIVK